MTKLILFFSVTLSVFSTNVFAVQASQKALDIKPSIRNYSCKGKRVSGALQITNYGRLNNDYWPYYDTATEFYVDGAPYRWNITRASVRPWKKPVFGAPKGTWVPDESRLVYLLGGREQSFDGWYASFYVQVNNQNWRKLKGYLGFKDAERAEIGQHKANTYNFVCYQR